MFSPTPPLGFIAPPPPLAPPLPAFPTRVAPFTPGGVPQELPGFLQPFPLPTPFQQPTPFQPLGVPPLPLPNDFPRDAIAPGPIVVPAIPAPFSGGQCQVQYNVRARANYSSGTVFESNIRMRVPGPILSARVEFAPAPFYRAVLTNAAGTVTSGLTNGGNGIQSVSVARLYREDTLPDDCGNPPDIAPAQRDENPARGFLPSPDFVPLPQPRINPPTFPEIAPPTRQPGKEDDPKRVLPPLFPDIPLPEIIPFIPSTIPELPDAPRLPPLSPETPSRQTPPFFPPQSPTPPTLPPLDPRIPTRQPIPPVIVVPILVPIPPPFNDDCCAVPEIIRQAEEIKRKIDEIEFPEAPECQDLCGEALLTQASCETVDGLSVPSTSFFTYTALAPALGFLSRQIADIKAQVIPCSDLDAANVAPILLASGTMTTAESVAYVAIGFDVREVELIIVGTIPASLRLYDTTQSGEQQGKFGSICKSYPGVTGGHAPDAFHQWAWTRRTLLNVGEASRAGREVRIYLRAGLSWVLYDTGVRS